MSKVSGKFLAAVERIVDHVEVDSDPALCEDVHFIRQFFQEMAERAVKVNQFLAERREAGARLDPATAEVLCTHGEILDPYGVWGSDLTPEERCYGRQYFARAPGSDLWVSFDDLPEETVNALRARMEAGEFDRDDDLPF
jgi:hypothetical protein